MLYFLIRPFVRLALPFYFRNICLSGIENIPRGKPFILAVNHPTAFLESAILGAYLHQPLHFLVRGDHFNKPVFRFLLRQGLMIPVFRQVESGFSSLKDNYGIFSFCQKAIAKGKVVALFPEGRTEHERRLRPLQRGIARIAFGTLREYPKVEDLIILPVGVNFSNALAFRSTVLVHFGVPIRSRAFYGDGSKPDYESLLKAVAFRLRENMVIIRRPEDDILVETCLMLWRNLHLPAKRPFFLYGDQWLRREQQLAAFWNDVATDSHKEETRMLVDDYLFQLHQFQIPDTAVELVPGMARDKMPPAFYSLFFRLGLLLVRLPSSYAEKAARKMQRQSFIGAVRFATGFGLALGIGICLLVLSIIFSPWLLPLIPLLGLWVYFAILFKEREDHALAVARFRGLSPANQQDLLNLKEKILAAFRGSSTE